MKSAGPIAIGTQKRVNPHIAPKCFSVHPFPNLLCRVHHTVVMKVLDAYVRRDPAQDRVIGTLMGRVMAGNIVNISDCFVDRYCLTGEGLLQIIKDHHEMMFELKQKVNSTDQVLGWFSTGSDMTELTCAVHGWFKQVSSVSKFMPHPPLVDPVHLLIDNTLSQPEGLSIRAYLQVPMNVVKEACFQFHEIAVELSASGPDHAVAKYLTRAEQGNSSNAESPMDGFEDALDKILILLKEANSYVTRVLQKEERGDPTIGRQLMQALSIDIPTTKDGLEQACADALEDNLMVAYLATLTKIQFALAAKLTSAFY